MSPSNEDDKNEMGMIKDEISKAIKTLSFPLNDIQLLEPERNKVIYEQCLNKFVNSGDRRWWWEDFKDPAFSVSDFERPFEHLEAYIPDLEKHVWFMVEDDENDYYPIYDCNPRILTKLIGECFGFEYYIIDKDLN